MNPKLKEKTKESLAAVLPMTGIVLAISIFFVSLELGPFVMFLVGALMLIVGMGFFQLGAEMAMIPIGEGIGLQIAKAKGIVWVLFIGFVVGAIVTISEPDLQVLAEQVPAIPNLLLVLTVAFGVGIFLALAILRIKKQIGLTKILIVLYSFLLVAAFFVPSDFVAVAFDSSGVTTGPMTVPFIMAMGIGLASARSDKNTSSDSFGLVALSSVGPILAVMILGFFYRPTESSYSLGSLASVNTTKEVIDEFAKAIPHYAKEVLISLLPIVAVFLIFQLFTRRYHKRQLFRISFGLIYTFVGLVLFLCGVNVGFAPVGALLGEKLALLSFNWVLIPIGMLIGYFIVKAEPAIQVLNHQVESVTDGAVSVKAMNRCMSFRLFVLPALALAFRCFASFLKFQFFGLLCPVT